MEKKKKKRKTDLEKLYNMSNKNIYEGEKRRVEGGSKKQIGENNMIERYLQY